MSDAPIIWLRSFGTMERAPYTDDEIFMQKKNRKTNKKAKRSIRIPRKRNE